MRTARLLVVLLACAACSRRQEDLLPRLSAAAKTRTDSLSLEHKALPALLPPLPSSTAVSANVPERGLLEFAVAVVGPPDARPPHVEFTVELTAKNGRAVLYRETVRPRDANRWNHRQTDLGAWKGQPVELLFRARPAPGHEGASGAFRIAWGNPTLRSRQPAQGAASRPSVLLVLVDALRPDYLGAYGFEGDVSPSLDRLAMESVLFENGYTVSPWTKPAIASLLTSLHPLSHGVTTGALPSEANTLAESLRGNGYETGAFVANPWLSADLGFAQGFAVYRMFEGSDELLSAAGHWIRKLPDGRPFFVYLHLMDVHAPYDKSEPEDDAAVAQSPGLGPSRPLTASEYRDMPPHMRRTSRVHVQEQLDLRAWRASYAAGVRALDRRLAPFLERLRTSGTLDRAYLMVTADHGEEFLDHGYWEHGYSLHEPAIRIPLLVRKPRAEGAGRRLAGLVSLVDLMPTILALTGSPPPPALQGQSLAGLLKGENVRTPPAVFAAATLNRPGLHAIRTDAHKAMIDLSTGDISVFDVKADPAERRNVAPDKPALADALRQSLRSHLAGLAARKALAPQEATLPPELLERLKALGYLR